MIPRSSHPWQIRHVWQQFERRYRLHHQDSGARSSTINRKGSDHFQTGIRLCAEYRIYEKYTESGFVTDNLILSQFGNDVAEYRLMPSEPVQSDKFQLE
jgi:hypothetical protein